MAQLKDLIVNGPSRFIGDVYATTFTGNLAGNANTATSATTAAALTGKTLVTASAVTTSNWSTYADNHIPTMSFIAYWNGAYSGTGSNLTYCKQGTIIGSNNIGSQSVKYATTSGSCSGNAATATKATQDGNGKVIASTYLPLSGGTMSNTNLVTNLNADLLDGLHAASFYQLKKMYSDRSSIYDLRYNYGTYDKGDFNGTYNDEYPTNYGAYLALTNNDKNTGALMFFDAPTSNVLGHIYVRTRGAGNSNTTYSEWGTLAYLTDNVASASKWANARTITLTGSVTGSVSIDGSQNVSLATTTNHTHTFASLTDKPTTISGYGITDAITCKYIIGKADFQYYVILLCQIGTNTTNTQHTINGTFWTTQGGSMRYQAAYINIHCSDWSSNHNEYYGFTPFGLGTKCRLVTCTYQSSQYLAITFQNTQACRIYFDGSYSNILFTPILYISKGGTIENSEIYNSITEVTYDKIPLISSAETALTSSNYNSYAPKLDGTGATGTWGINISGNAASVGDITGALIPAMDVSTGYWGSLGYGSTKKLSIGSNYGGVAWHAQNYCADLMFGCNLDTHGFISIGYNSPIVSFAGSNNTNASNDNPNWYFKLTGTSGTIYNLDCAPSATKLATPRTIWGQSFDGTGNVSGFPSFPACININRNTQTGALLDPSKIGFEIETYANDARLKTYSASSGSNQYHLVLTSSGNVGIGTVSPSYKLHIVGTAYASEGLVSDGPVKVNEYFVVDGTNGSWYGKLNIADDVYILGENTNINFIESLNIKQHNTTDNTETSIVSIDNSGNITLNVMNDNGGSYKISTELGSLGIGIPSDDPNLVNTPSFLMSPRGYIFLNASLPSSPSYPLVVNGTIQCTTLSQTSDIKYKTNIKQIEYEEALKIIENLNPVTWDWNENTVETGSSSGFVAQEAEEFIPNAISRDNENNLSLDYTQLHSYEIRVIQEQQKEIIKLKEKLKILENLIS